jgi:hypothetical protein
LSLLASNDTIAEIPEPPPCPEDEKDRKSRLKEEKISRVKERVEEAAKLWKPEENVNATEDPYKTLFVGRVVSFLIFLFSIIVFSPSFTELRDI